MKSVKKTPVKSRMQSDASLKRERKRIEQKTSQPITDGHSKTSPETKKESKPSHTSIALRDELIAGFHGAVKALPKEVKEVTGDSHVIARIPVAQRTTDELIALIDSGKFIAEIAREWRVDRSQLTGWIQADVHRSARAAEARKAQAAHWDLEAEKVLLEIKRGADKAEVMRARELAAHYRWRAKCFNVVEYGDNITVQHEEKRDARELTTEELRIIAAGGVLPGGF